MSNLLSNSGFNMSQMIPKEVFHNTAYSVQLPYIAGHSLYNFINYSSCLLSFGDGYSEDLEDETPGI